MLSLFLLLSSNLFACENSAISLVSYTDNGASHDYIVQVCVGGGVLGLTTGADGPTRTFSLGLRTVGDAAVTISNATPSITSTETLVTLSASIQGPQGGIFDNQGNILYLQTGGTDFACITSTALCGEPASDCFNISFTTDVELEEITAFGIEGSGNPAAGCTGDPDMTIDLTSLPVQFTHFQVSEKLGAVMLEWETEMEINNAFFSIERSSNGRDFETIGRVDGSNNSDRLVKYQFNDLSATEGFYYYRLKQVDFTGEFTYSQIVSLSVKEAANSQVRLYPNPVSGPIQLITSSGISSNDVTIRVYNSMGQLLLEDQYIWERQITIPTAALSPGIYTVCLYTGQKLHSQQRFVKQ